MIFIILYQCFLSMSQTGISKGRNRLDSSIKLDMYMVWNNEIFSKAFLFRSEIDLFPKRDH